MTKNPARTGLETDADAIPVRPGEEMDWAALITYLGTRLDDFPASLQIS